ncbi:hypothetical protein [Senegalia massiliensis]|uniref:hypothetical protein n=1 Tax=Senegalia massiliensis TaxID=1720316 RepID=UPI00102FE4D1|nr:hypothetical protein [Senegalia massiliensis]
MRKMDEMEMQISLISIKWAWFYTVIFLFVWSIVNFINTRETSIPFILLISQNLIFLGLQTYLKWKLGKDEE